MLFRESEVQKEKFKPAADGIKDRVAFHIRSVPFTESLSLMKGTA